MKSIHTMLFPTIALFLVSACGDDQEGKTASQSSKASVSKPATATPAAKATMNPATWPQMMGQAPGMLGDPVALCAQCHTPDDMKRYRTSMQPMLKLMSNPTNWMKPEAYSQAMRPMMDPETYTQWYNAWMQMMGMPRQQTGSSEK